MPLVCRITKAPRYLLFSIVVLRTAIPCAGADETRPAVDFDREMAPLFAARCLECHNPTDRKGKLDLTRRAAVMAGGENGPVIESGRPEESLLWQYVESEEMPPDEPLSAKEKALVKAWIHGGARWGADPIDPFRFTTDRRGGYDWWSLQPVAEVKPPEVDDARWAENPIDRFVFAKLAETGLRPSPPADRRTLFRRLSYDLLGLPPSPREVAEFIADGRPGAYDRLVERMLASPHYGQRWARHWLDVVRFGESQGFERDKLRENAWPYRDWVIDALNRDLPFDEFTRLQIGGDVLRPDDAQAIIATGFLVAGPWDEVGQKQQSAVMKAVVRQDELEDLVSVVGQTFLGLTVHCARCHDHKFDAVRQREYYQLAAALGGARHGEREVGGEFGKVYAVAAETPEMMHVLHRGNPANPGAVVAAGGVQSLVGLDAGFGLPPDAPDGDRRRRLAEWITNPCNPLFARVIVNRLWHYHFGVGLVETPSDFGFNGGRPSHPRLLDWLAGEAVRRGWSAKSMHRLIVTSAVYRQGSRHVPNAAALDADNRLLWRKSPVRLEAEAVRDSVLAVAGQLNQTMGGPGYRDFETFVQNTQFYVSVDPEGAEFNRRTVYRTWVRSGRNGLLDVLDCPDPSTKTPRRAVTTTPLQALSLLNNSFLLRMADCFAARLEREAGPDAVAQVSLAYELAYGRKPTAEEIALGQTFVKEHGLAALCRVVFNTNEFLYVD